MYRKLRLAKLGITSFDYGRVIVEPAFAPEHSVSLYRKSTPDGHVRAIITYVVADRNLWDATNGGIDIKRAQQVKTRRIDCEIPTRTAEKVRQVWIAMLAGKQRPIPMRAEDAARTTDATTTEFSIQLSTAETLYGEIAAEAPSGPKTRALLELVTALVHYCESDSEHRVKEAHRIDREATKLIVILEDS
jgi:hypothetical protein